MKRIITYPLGGLLIGAVIGIVMAFYVCDTAMLSKNGQQQVVTACPAMSSPLGVYLPSMFLMTVFSILGLSIGIVAWWRTRNLSW